MNITIHIGIHIVPGKKKKYNHANVQMNGRNRRLWPEQTVHLPIPKLIIAILYKQLEDRLKSQAQPAHGRLMEENVGNPSNPNSG